MSCNTTDAEIYYTLDGTTPSNQSTLYSTPFTVSSTTTVNAIAYASGLGASDVATATYTAVDALDGVKALREKIASDASSTATEYFVKLTNAVVTKVGSTVANSTSNNVAFIEQDGTGIYVFCSGHGLSAGDVLNGTLTVSGCVYQGNPEVTALSGYTKTSGTAPEPTEVTIAQLNSDFDTYGYRYVVVKNVPVTTAITSGSSGNRNSTVTVGDASMIVRSANTGVTLDAGSTYDIKGVMIKYNTTSSESTQFMLYSADDAEVVSDIEAPTFSVEQGIYSEKQSVTLSCATSGTTIYYTIDGTDPTNESTEYTEAISVSSSEKIKAIAYSGSDKSPIATAIYVIGDGSTYENGFTPKDVLLMKELGSYPTDDVWVLGYIIGSASSATSLEDTDVDANVALAEKEDETTNFITVQLPSSGHLQELAGLKSNPSNKSKMIGVYGKVQKYWTDGCGVKSTSKIWGLNSVKINTTEGYGTYYTNCAFEMPEGLTGSIITGVEDGKLVIKSKYSAGDVVPANTGLLLKGENGKSYDLINTNSTADAPTNKLNGSVAETTTTGGDKYYMLSYESSEHKSLGFYWGEADGAAFTNGAHKAYLALTTAEAGTSSSTEGQVKGFALDDSTTGINHTMMNAATPAAVYTIDGRRVENSSSLKSGLYIVNGHKVIVK